MKRHTTRRDDRFRQSRQHPQSHQGSHGQQHNKHDEKVSMHTRHTHSIRPWIRKLTFDVTWHPQGDTNIDARRRMTASPMSTARDDHGTAGRRHANGRPRKTPRKPMGNLLCHRDMTTPTDASYLHDGGLLDSGSSRPTEPSRRGYCGQRQRRCGVARVGDPTTSMLNAI